MFVFNPSALNQRVQSVLESWNTTTKGRRYGLKDEKKLEEKGGEDLSVRSTLVKGFLWTGTS